jgi:hypothetical protein
MFRKSIMESLEPTPVQPRILQTCDNEFSSDEACAFPSDSDESNEALSPRSAASTSFARLFGLDVRAAVLAIIVDLMVFAGDTLSVETLVPLGIGVAAVLGFIVYKIQRKWYGDDHESAFIKAMVIGLLTAIPMPLTPLIAIPSGIAGVVKAIRRK